MIPEETNLQDTPREVTNLIEKVKEEIEELIRTRAHDGQITAEYAEIDLIRPSGET